VLPAVLAGRGRAGGGVLLVRQAGAGLPREGIMDVFDVRVHAIRRRDRRRPFEVRWHAAGRAWSRSFITRGLADSYRAELVRAARRGLEFSAGTGEPACWAGPEAGR
jgi:hypothetical protein